MKCVKLLETEEVKRLPNENARKLVRDGMAVFVPKSVYKHGSETILAMPETTSAGKTK